MPVRIDTFCTHYVFIMLTKEKTMQISIIIVIVQ